MEAQEQGGILRLRAESKALVSRPDWHSQVALGRPSNLLVAVDLAGVEFVSSLFLAGCVRLGRRLACSGRMLVMLNLTPHHKRVLELVEGGSTLALVDDEQQLHARLMSLKPECGAPDGGVGAAEKNMLWS